jgi:prepilin-type N-terminal cleavage/methylation domain-containing protein
MRTLTKQRKAFTMIELVFVIVVLGILAALALPRMDRDLRQEAKDNILSAIRYTQYLALMDNKTNPTDANWQKKLWQIRFSTSTDNLANFYTVSSDSITVNGAVSKEETAIDPINGKYMYNAGGDTTIDPDESPNIFIGKKYGVNSMNFSGGCAGAQHIAFDHLGRPHNGLGAATNDYSQYMSSDCIIIIGFEDSAIIDLNVTIATETGYVDID